MLNPVGKESFPSLTAAQGLLLWFCGPVLGDLRSVRMPCLRCAGNLHREPLRPSNGWNVLPSSSAGTGHCSPIPMLGFLGAAKCDNERQ